MDKDHLLPLFEVDSVASSNHLVVHLQAGGELSEDYVAQIEVIDANRVFWSGQDYFHMVIAATSAQSVKA